MRIDFLNYALPLLEEDEINEVIDTLKSNWISKGPKTIEFERQFASYVGVKHAVAMNSCTAALHVALVAKGIGKGCEVITTPYTFVATSNVIIQSGAKPVFVDIDPVTYNIDPNKIEQAITEKTKAIIPVHFAGFPCDMNKIKAIAKKYHLFVLEDAAHAIYSTYKGQLIGSISDATAFSFYATKNLVTAEGGMLTTNDDELAEKARVISLHGMNRDAWNRYGKSGNWFYEVLYPGFKYNMTDIQASLGIHQLKKLAKLQDIREQIASRYNEAFQDMEAIKIPYYDEESRHAWHLYVIQINEAYLTINRNQFIEELKKRNIGSSVHFIPVHLHPYYQNTYGYKLGDYKVAESVYHNAISLPLYPLMSIKDVEDVIDAVKDIARCYQK